MEKQLGYQLIQPIRLCEIEIEGTQPFAGIGDDFECHVVVYEFQENTDEHKEDYQNK